MTVRGHQLAVDWSEADDFEGVLEDVTSYLRNEPVIEIAVGRDGAQTTLHSASGRMDFALNNLDRDFSPENPASPIAGKIEPGRRVRYQVLYEEVLHTLIDGVLDEFDVDPSSAPKTFTGTVLDSWGRPGAERLSTDLYSGIRTGAAIDIILDEIGWTGPRSLDPGVTSMPWWWAENTDAASAVADIVNSEGAPAIAYVHGGTFYFRDRHHRLLSDASQTTQGLYTHIVPAGSGPGGDLKIEKDSFVYDHGLRNIANAVAFSVDVRTPGPETEVWSSEDPIELASGESTVIHAESSDPFFNAAVAATVDFGTVSTAISRTSGQAVVIDVTASTAARIGRLAVVATPVPVSRTVKVNAEDASSVARHGRQTWPGTVPWANRYDAQAIADRIIATYATNRPTVTFSIAGIDEAHLDQIMWRRISDRITVRNDPVGVNADFIVERLVHRITKLGLIHRLELSCQVVDPGQPANILTFNLAGSGFNDGAFGLVGIDNPTTMFLFDTAGQGFNDGVFAT